MRRIPYLTSILLLLPVITYAQSNQAGVAAAAAAASQAAAAAQASQAAAATQAAQVEQARQADQDAQRNQTAHQNGSQQVATFHTVTRLVVVDVVVSDDKGVPVTGLKQSDFSLIEGKVPQTIRSFEVHTAAEASAHVVATPKLPAGVFSNTSAAPVNGTVNIILLDTLNTPVQDQAYARQQLVEYLKTAKPGSNTAIFGLTTRLNMLQGFTSDPEILRRVVDKKLPSGSVLLDDQAGGGGLQDSVVDQLTDGGVSADFAYNFASFEALNQTYMLQLRARYTLDALSVLARYLSGIPGRKNLIWFSGSFPINILPDATSAGDPFAGVASAEEEYRETANLLSRSQVAVYPVDARGLLSAPSISAATSGARYGRNSTNFGKDQTTFLNQIADEHSTLFRMADDTGGRAFVNTNGLADAVAKAIDFGSNYYTLSYTPSEVTSRNDFRSIQVKLAQAGYTLAYRKGYYADESNTASAAATAPSRGEAMRQAAMFGAPPATQLSFKSLVREITRDPEPTAASGNYPEPTGKEPAKGPWNRYLVRFAVDPSTVTFPTNPDGARNVDLEFVTLVYDHDGNRINSVDSTVTTKIPASSFASVQQAGLFYQQQISTPVHGDYRLRILVNDHLGSHLGSIEVPIAAIKNLPLAVMAASSSAVPPAASAPTASPLATTTQTH